MKGTEKFANVIEGWLKPAPHMPNEWRKWLAHNSWWLTLIGVIIGVLGLFGLLGALFVAMSFIGAATSVFGVAVTAAAYSGYWFLSALLSLAILIVFIVISIMAITPLKAMSKKGWDLLFVAYLVQVVSIVANILMNLTPASIVMNVIGGAIGLAIGAYVLFEVRSYFKTAEKK